MQSVRLQFLIEKMNLNAFSFVTATSQRTLDLQILSNYRSLDRSQLGLFNSCRIWEAARATTAAVTFFEPITIGRYGETFVDGSLTASNPIEVVLREAIAILDLGGTSQSFIPANLVSVGCGYPQTNASGVLSQNILKTLQAISTSVEVEADRFARGHGRIPGLRYFRFNIQKGIEDINLDEWAQLSRLSAAAREYLTTEVTSNRLKECIAALEISEEVPVPQAPAASPSTTTSLRHDLPEEFDGLELIWPDDVDSAATTEVE